MINKIRTHIEAGEFDRYGLRVMHADQVASAGTILPASRRWDDGECTDEVLSGTSAINVTADKIEQAVRALEPYRWMGGAIVLIAGHESEWGEDAGEILIRDAKILEVLA